MNDKNTIRLSPAVRRLVLETIGSPWRAIVTIVPASEATSTEVRLDCAGETVGRWTFPVAPHAISEADIQPVQTFLAESLHRRPAALKTMLRLLGWSLGFTGLFAASTVCPCCGQVGCAVGVGTMGVMGGLTAAVVALVHRRRRRRGKESQSC